MRRSKHCCLQNDRKNLLPVGFCEPLSLSVMRSVVAVVNLMPSTIAARERGPEVNAEPAHSLSLAPLALNQQTHFADVFG